MSDREKLIEILSVPIYPHLDADPAEVVADYLIDNGVTVQKWIPVSERLPEENKPPKAYCDTVQVLLESGTVTVGWCNRYLGKWFYLPYGETRFANSIIGYPPVVAWKPLSEPPKECE